MAAMPPPPPSEAPGPADPAPPDPAQAEAVLRRLAEAARAAEAPPAAAPGAVAFAGDPGAAWAEARYRTLVEQIPAVTFLAGLAGQTNELYVSPQIERLLGFTQKEWLEDPVLWYRQLHPDDRQRWHEEFARTCAGGEHFRSEYRFLARDGRVVWVHGECQVVRDAAGRPLFLQGIAYDITENKRGEEVQRRMHEQLGVLVRERTAELLKANEALRAEIRERRRLEEALQLRAAQLAEEGRRKDEFLAILAHELRNPLAPIRSALAILRQPGATAPVAEWAKQVMDRQLRQITRLIDDLLDVSRINQGKIELRRERVVLAEVVARAVESTRPLLADRQHELAVVPAPEPLVVDGDPVRLEQVAVNLINNAAKYTPPGGHVDVVLERAGDEAVLRVRDTGVGIPAEMLERIFDLFIQVNRSLSSTSQWGLGIGLTLVRNLVQMHGGRVQAASAGPGRGSEFVVRLPLVSPAPRPDEGPAGPPQQASSPRGRRVLVVDDNTDLADSMALLLRSWGYEVGLAHDGQAALAAARDRRPEVVLLDIGLPGMSGYEVARRLRDQAGLKGAFLVALTGYGRDDDRRRAQEAGFNCHLTKPVEPEVLQDLLANAETLVNG